MPLFEKVMKKGEDTSISKKEYDKLSIKLLSNAEKSAKGGDLENAAWLYQRLSILARRAKEWDDGVKYALLAADYCGKQENSFNCGWSYRAAALAARGKKDHRSTIEYALKGAEKFREAGSVYAAQWCYKTAALACKDDGKPAKAIKFYEKANSIERDDDIRHEVDRLKHDISHPRVDQYAEKAEVVEGDPVRFEAVVENHSQNVLKNIVIGDSDARVTHEIEKLDPGEVKILSYERKGRIGRLQSPYNYITWVNEDGQTMDFEIEPISVTVRPKIQVTPHIHPEPVNNKSSKLVLLIKNLSSTVLYDVKVEIDFGETVRSPYQDPKIIKKMLPGNEYGAAWSMKPTASGKHRIAEGKILMHDEKGGEYEEDLPNIIADVNEVDPQPRKHFKSQDEFRAQKSQLEKSINANPITESLYAELEKKFWHQQRGYTLRGLGMDVLEKHLKDNCADMSLVSEHDLGDEKMFLFSFSMGAHYLLTAILKKDDDFMHVILKLYSEKKEGLVSELGRISDVIIHSMTSEAGAHEVENVEIKKVVNIIDSVVQRSKIGTGDGEAKDSDLEVKDSVVQRSEV